MHDTTGTGQVKHARRSFFPGDFRMKLTNRHSKGLLASAAILASISIGGDAFAQVVATDNYCIPTGSGKLGGFDQTDLGNTLVANGNAQILADGRFQLTAASFSGGQASTVFYQEPLTFRYTDVPLKTPRQFHVFFSFSMGPTALDVEAGSGLAFLVQNNLKSSIGSNGDGMGFGGLKKSFAFEFDTHKDTPSSGTVLYEDPVVDHIGFMLDGNQSEHPAFYKPLDANQNQLEFNSTGPDLKRFYVWIDFAGGTGPDAKKYKLYLSETKTKPATSIVWEEHLDFTGADLQNPNFPESGFDPDYWLSTQMAGAPGQGWVGFSAATYGSIVKNDHYIHEFEFSNKGIPCACQGAEACKTAAGTAACSAGPMTQNSGECVECTEADETPCSGSKPVCDKVNEVCVECNTNAECLTMENPHCDPVGHICVPCATDADCSEQPGTPVCLNGGTPMAACVECLDNADCSGSPTTPACSVATMTCVECLVDADCSGSPTTPACSVATMTCVECEADTDCKGNTPVCDLPKKTCVECEADSDCGSDAPVCDTVLKTCGACATDADCSAYPTNPMCQLAGASAGQCGPVVEVVNMDSIEGGGFSCSFTRSSVGDGFLASVLAAACAAVAVARRRRRVS